MAHDGGERVRGKVNAIFLFYVEMVILLLNVYMNHNQVTQ